MLMLQQRNKPTKEHVFKDKKLRKTKNVINREKKKWLKKSTVETIPQIQKILNLARRAIHIHGGMEHNLARYAKYCSCGGIKISRGSEFTREIDRNRKDFLRHW